MALPSSQDAKPRFSIPEPQARIFTYLCQLDFPALTELLTSLSSVRATVFPVSHIGAIATKFADSEHSSEEIARAILSLHGTRQGFATMTDADFVDTAVRSIKAKGARRGAESKLRSLFINLLGLKALRVSVKATRLVLDSERHMHDASLCTDLRPVFDTVGSAIDGYVIMHTLKIDYVEAGEDRELHMYVDEDDLTALEEAVVRARRKSAVLRANALTTKTEIIGGN
ncbi:MAG: hypothetical protein ABIW82_03890 [Dokdonella sp.]